MQNITKRKNEHLHDITAVESTGETDRQADKGVNEVVVRQKGRAEGPKADRQTDRQTDNRHLLFKPCQHITISAKQDLWFTNNSLDISLCVCVCICLPENKMEGFKQ